VNLPRRRSYLPSTARPSIGRLDEMGLSALAQQRCTHSGAQLLWRPGWRGGGRAYGSGFSADPKRALFRTIGRTTGQPTNTALPQASAHAMIRRRASAAGIRTQVDNHTFRVTRLAQGVRLQASNHNSITPNGITSERSLTAALLSFSEPVAKLLPQALQAFWASSQPMTAIGEPSGLMNVSGPRNVI
jgi:hypothetical protein